MPEEELYIGVQEYTMEFNEMQKRVKDINSPKFWLQKGLFEIQHHKVDAAVDYYK